MHPDAVDSREEGKLLKRPREPCLRGRNAVVAEHEVAFPQDGLLRVLPLRKLAKRICIEVDGAHRRAGLRLGEVPLVHVPVVEGLRDGAKPRLKVDIAPRQGGRFPQPHAAHEQKAQADVEVVLVVVPFIEHGKDAFELLKRPKGHLGLLATDVPHHTGGVSLRNAEDDRPVEGGGEQRLHRAHVVRAVVASGEDELPVLHVDGVDGIGVALVEVGEVLPYRHLAVLEGACLHLSPVPRQVGFLDELAEADAAHTVLNPVGRAQQHRPRVGFPRFPFRLEPAAVSLHTLARGRVGAEVRAEVVCAVIGFLYLVVCHVLSLLLSGCKKRHRRW